MRNPISSPRWAPLIVFLAFGCGFSNAAVVHKIDDTSITGDLKSIDDDKLVVTTKAAPISIPLDEIAQVTLKDPPAPVVPPPPPVVSTTTEQEGPNLGGTLLGALFGSSHSQSSAETPSEKVVVPAVTPATKPALVPTTGKASAPAMPVAINGIFQLTDGDTLHATLQGWADQKLLLHLTSGGALQIPSTALRQVWLGTQEMQTKAGKLPLDPGPEDIAFVAKDNEVVIVKGLVQGIDNNSLQFRYDEQDRKIALGKVVGVILRSNTDAPIAAFHQAIHTDTGDQISGILTAVDHDTATLMTPLGLQIKVPMPGITTIDFLNGRVTFLTDLKPAKVEQTPYFGRLIPYRINQSLDGGPLVLSDGPCPRGIAVHSRCVLRYDLTGGFDRFKTRLGFAQPDGQQGRVLARVLGDGKALYENPDARGDQAPVEIDVALGGVRTLTLEIDFGKDQDVGDRVVWANPRLLRVK